LALWRTVNVRSIGILIAGRDIVSGEGRPLSWAPCHILALPLLSPRLLLLVLTIITLLAGVGTAIDRLNADATNLLGQLSSLLLNGQGLCLLACKLCLCL